MSLRLLTRSFENGLFRDNYLSLELVHSMKGTDAWLLMFMKPFLSQCSSARCDMLSLILSWLILMECLDVCFPGWTSHQRASSDWIRIRPKIWFSFFTFSANRDTVEEIGHVVVSRLKILTLNLIRVQYSISFFFSRGHGNESFNLIGS